MQKENLILVYHVLYSSSSLSSSLTESKLITNMNNLQQMIVTGIPNHEMTLRIIRIYTYILERINSDQSLTLGNINSWPLTVPATELQLLQTPIGWITIPYEVLAPKFTSLVEITYTATTEFELYLFQSLFIFTDLTYYKTGYERVVDYFLNTKNEDELVVITPMGPKIIKTASDEAKQLPDESADQTTIKESTTILESTPISKPKNHRVYFGSRKLEEKGYNYHGYKYTQLGTIKKNKDEEENYIEEEVYQYRKEGKWAKFKITTKNQISQEEVKLDTTKERVTIIEIKPTTSTRKTEIKPATPTSQLIDTINLCGQTEEGYGGIGALEMGDDNSSSDIYQIIVKHATNNQTGKLSEPVSLQNLKYGVISKGYTPEQLTTFIEEYIYLNIWYLVDNGQTLRISPMKCKKKIRGRRR